MKKSVLAALAALSLTTAFTTGCGSDRKVVKQEVSDKPGLLGGRKYEEKTTYRNADGTLSTEEKKIKTP